MSSSAINTCHLQKFSSLKSLWTPFWNGTGLGNQGFGPRRGVGVGGEGLCVVFNAILSVYTNSIRCCAMLLSCCA